MNKINETKLETIVYGGGITITRRAPTRITTETGIEYDEYMNGTKKEYKCLNCKTILRSDKNLNTHTLTNSCKTYREKADAWREKTGNPRVFHSLLNPNVIFERK